MSKNRRKPLKKEPVISKTDFSFYESKIYIIATIIMFHIVPLVFVMMGENGQLLLLQFFLMMLNPMFIALSGLIYGIKQGFNFKFPLFMAIISMVSIPMYYQFDAAANMMMTTIIMCIVYAIFSFAATVITERIYIMESKKLYGASTQMTPAVYKDFYKTYYNEKLKVFKIVAEIVGLIAIFGAFYILANGYGILWGAIALWIGAFLLFYPRMIYRKPYKNAKDNSQTTHFAFFENYMSEKTKSHVNEYKYDDIQKVFETGKYFFIFHNSESVSIVDKAHFSGDVESFSGFIKTKTQYKKIK